MLTVLRYLLLIVTAMLDHFCPEFCLPHIKRAAQETEMAAVSIYRPLGEREKGANCDNQQSALGISVGYP
jgi:2-keto-3-deoxy-L-rhamnonate aldolase RhmA